MVNIAVNNTPSPGSGIDQTPFYPGTQRPLLKHKDKQGSTEHHRGRRGGTASQGGSSPEMVEALAVQISGISEGVGNDLADQGVDIDSPEYDQELARLTFEDPEVEAMIDDELDANNLDIEGPAREQLERQVAESLGFSEGMAPTATAGGHADEFDSAQDEIDYYTAPSGHQARVEGGSAPEIDTGGKLGPDAPGTEPGSYWHDRGVQPEESGAEDHAPNEIWTGQSGYQQHKGAQADRKMSRSQTTLSNMFGKLGNRAIGQQTPILEKHKDKQGSTEHHKRGAGATRGELRPKTKDAIDRLEHLIENPPVGMTEDDGKAYRQMLDEFSSREGTNEQYVSDGLSDIAGNTRGYHRVEQVNQFSEALESGDSKDTRALAENLAEIAGNTSGEHREEQINQFQQHLAEEMDLPSAATDEEDDEPKWMSYPDGPQQERVAEREGWNARAAEAPQGREAQTGPRMPSEKQHPVPRWGDPVNDPGRG